MIQSIEDKLLLYISNELSEKEKKDFEQKLFKSESLQKLYLELKHSDQAVRNLIRIKEAPEFKNPPIGSYKFLSIAASIVIIISLYALTISESRNEKVNLIWDDNSMNRILVLELEVNHPLLTSSEYGTNFGESQNFDLNIYEIEKSIFQIQKND